MAQLNPHLTWSPEGEKELAGAIARQSDLLQHGRTLIEAGQGRRDAIYSAACQGSYLLARMTYAQGSPNSAVKSHLAEAVAAYRLFHGLVLSSLRGRADGTGAPDEVWGDPGKVDTCLLIQLVLGTKDPFLAAAPKEAVESPNMSYGPEFNHCLHALRHQLSGRTEDAVSELEKARKAKGKECWEIYRGPLSDKSSRKHFGHLTGTEDLPLGAIVLKKPDRFVRAMEAVCAAFDLASEELIREKQRNLETLIHQTAWSLEATAFAAWGLREGFPPPPRHYAIASELIG